MNGGSESLHGSSSFILRAASGIQTDTLISVLIRDAFPCRIFFISGRFLSLTLSLGSLRFVVHTHQISVDLCAFRYIEHTITELALDARLRFQLGVMVKV